MLCHALGNRRANSVHPGEMEEEIVAVSISGGVVIQTQDLTRCSEYIVSNIKDEKFAFVLDHEKLWDGNLTCTMGDKTVDPSESLKNGARFEFELPPGDQMTLTVNEQFTQEQRITIGGRNYGVNTLKDFFIAAEHPLAENRGIQEVVKLQATVDELDEQKEELDSRCEVVGVEQQRVAGLLQKDPNNEEWKKRPTASKEWGRRSPEKRNQILLSSTKPRCWLGMRLSTSWCATGRSKQVYEFLGCNSRGDNDQSEDLRPTFLFAHLSQPRQVERCQADTVPELSLVIIDIQPHGPHQPSTDDLDGGRFVAPDLDFDGNCEPKDRLVCTM